MQRLTIETGLYEVNTSILSIDGLAWVVDPGSEADRIISIIENKGLEMGGVLLTHAHFDHIGAIPEIKKIYPDIPVYVHPSERQVLVHPMNQMPPDYPPVEMPSCLLDSCPIKDCEVIETPGHTPGGVSFYFPKEKLLLAGDTLFAGSVGRTDLPGGDMATLMGSIQKLKALPDDTIVIPGHASATTIGDEKKSNPFMM